MADIVERLRELADGANAHTIGELWNGLEEAADEIERLRARIDVLESRELDHYTELEDQLERAHMSLVPEGMVLVPLTELEAQRVPEGCALIPLTERMPDPDKHPRVVVYTEGYDFQGEQFFDVDAESLNENRYADPADQPEVCRYATHWIGADELAALTATGGRDELKHGALPGDFSPKSSWVPAPELTWFAYCPDNGFEFYASEAEAVAASRALIDSWLDDSWAEEVEQIYIGQVTHTAQQVNLIERPPAEELDEDGIDQDGRWWDSDWDRMCNYAPLPLAAAQPEPSQGEDA